MTKDEIIAKFPMVADRKGETLYVSLDSVIKCMDEYAKQQAIAFIEWAIDNDKIVPVGYGTDSVKLEYTGESIYNQFIEQQNKK